MPEPLRWTGLRYRDPLTGRYISRAAVRTALEESLANLTRKTDTLADDLRAGRISLHAWREEMRETIKQSIVASHQLAKGGRAQMTPSDYLAAGRDVQIQYAYLDNWTRQIANGAPVGANVEPRARQYLLAARSSFLKIEAETMREAGFLAKSTLHASESCAECIAEAAKGYVDPAYLVPIGARTCKNNCRCVLVYARAA